MSVLESSVTERSMRVKTSRGGTSRVKSTTGAVVIGSTSGVERAIPPSTISSHQGTAISFGFDHVQAYFWTRAWQEGERAAEQDIRSGRTHDFSSIEDALDWLRSDE